MFEKTGRALALTLCRYVLLMNDDSPELLSRDFENISFRYYGIIGSIVPKNLIWPPPSTHYTLPIISEQNDLLKNPVQKLCRLMRRT